MNAFDGIAGEYGDARPTYPAQLWRHLQTDMNMRDVPALAVDIGAGSGISTRQLADALPGWEIVGLEPGKEMLAEAKRDSDGTDVEFRFGNAEQLPFDDQTTGIVMAAQALQWFDRPLFFAEATRVLHPAGLLVILQNNRNWHDSEFLERYESLLELTSAGYSRMYRSFSIDAELAEAGFTNIRFDRVGWVRTMTVANFTTMARSSSKMDAAISNRGELATIGALTKLLHCYADEDTISIPYIAELYRAERPF